MALKKPSTRKPSAKNEMEKAPAWLNFAILDKHGRVHNVRRGLPAYTERDTTLAGIVAREKTNRQAYDDMVSKLPAGSEVPTYQPYVFNLTCTVYITPEGEPAPVEFE